MQNQVLDEADVYPIKGSNALSASKPAGYLHAIGGVVGIVLADILGTGVALTAAAALGFPLTDGVGDGLGEMAIEGVFDVLCHSGIAAHISLGDALYYDGTNNNVNVTNSGSLAGHVWPQDNGGVSRAAVASPNDPSFFITNSPTYVVVRVKLLGFPKTGLV